MGQYTVVVLADALPGQEQEFWRWYEEDHIPDVLKVPGITAAQRFAVMGHAHGHAAVYDLDCDDPAAVVQEMVDRSGTDRMPLSPTLDASRGFDLLILDPIGRKQSASRAVSKED